MTHGTPILLAPALLVLLAPGGLAGQAAGANGSEPGSEPIFPGDLVRLTAMEEEALTGEFSVNESGSVVLPTLGESQAYFARG